MDNFKVEYKDKLGEIVKVDKVYRVKRDKLKDIIDLQQDLLYSFFKSNASIGQVIADSVNWKNIEKLAKMLPVVGEEKLGFDLSSIENDLSQLLTIFFTQSIDENGNLINSEEAYKPSLIAELHQLDYYGAVQESAKKIYQERLKDDMLK